MTHRLLGSAAALTAALTAVLAVGPGPAAAAASAQRTHAVSYSFRGVPRVGAIFAPGASTRGGHFCSASVVDSPGRSLVVTAAHCVVTPGGGPARNGLVFVPGYHDGSAPYGRWPVRRVSTDPRWSAHGNPDYDVAFLTVAPGSGGIRLQDTVGSEAIAFNTPRNRSAVAVGYPRAGDRPVYCPSVLRRLSSTQSEFDCSGLPGGTSGGPLLVGANAHGDGRGTLVGVIGGYQLGGNTADVSYSPYFGAGIAALYRTAARG